MRCLLLEQPALETVAVDLGHDGASVKDEAAALLTELSTPPGEDHIAWRGLRRLVGRLHRCAPAARVPIEIAPDRCHVVTGALGAIGLRVVNWLIERGARDVV